MLINRREQPEAPLLEELASIGVWLDSIWSTNHIKMMPAKAFKIIFKHLAFDYATRTKEGIARSLGRREARDVVWKDLLQIYRSLAEDQGKDRLKEGVGSSLHVMARSDDLETLIELISDPANGPTRIFFVRNLSRIRNPKALETLVKLRNEPDLHKEIEFVLKGKLKRKQSISGSKN